MAHACTYTNLEIPFMNTNTHTHTLWEAEHFPSHCVEHSGLFYRECDIDIDSIHSHTHPHARSHNNTASSWRSQYRWSMNIVGSVVGWFVVFVCYTMWDCNGVGCLPRIGVLFGLPRYTSCIHNIFIHLLLLNYTDIYILRTHHLIHLPCALQ